MTVETENTPATPSIVDARDALAQALARPLAFWELDATSGWRLSEAAPQNGEPSLHDFVNFDQLAGLLEEVQATGCVCTLHATPEWDLLAAPLRENSGTLRGAATGLVDAANCDLFRQLAEFTLRDWHQRQEIDWLRDENFVFSQQVTDDFEELTFLRTMATHMVVDDTTLDIRSIVAQAVGGLREMIGAETIYFVTAEVDGKLSVAQCCSSRPESDLKTLRAVITRVAGDHCQRAAFGPCVRNDLSTCDPAARDGGIRQFLMVPIAAGTQSFGWFVAVNRGSDGRKWAPSPLLQLGHDEFGTWEASLLSTAATLLASHASNLDLVREKEQLLVNTVRSLVTALDSKDTYTRGHSERVALFSKRIAETLGYDAVAAEKLYLSGLLHDVGKIGVSDAVLRKPDKLTAEEFDEIKRHPDEGWSILRDLEQMRYVLPGVLHHHEQVNGSGYPDGLAGEAIPLDARIMAVADAYDAMTSDRAYRAGMPHEKAMSIIADGAGKQWDADVVAAFSSVVDDIVAIRYGYRQAERSPRAGSALAPSCQS